jgi:2-phosphosulfolactate phosphatase
MIRVFFLPTLVTPEQLADRTVVVVDVLRATTTIVHALAAGAERVIPCAEVDQAREVAQGLGTVAILGGERGGRQIPGFHLGNSPAEYTQTTVGGKVLVFTTTNGTRAMVQARLAGPILLGAFVNFSAVCLELDRYVDFDVVCAGTRQQISRDDVLLAGAIVADRTRKRGHLPLNDQAELAVDAWDRVERSAWSFNPIAQVLRNSHGGRHLLDLGMGGDIELAAQLDRFSLVPRLNPHQWVILQ